MTKEEAKKEMEEVQRELQTIADGHPDLKFVLHVMYRFEDFPHLGVEEKVLIPERW